MHNIGSLDPSGGTGVSHRVDQDSFPEVSNGHVNLFKEGILAGGRGSPEPSSEGSSSNCKTASGPVHKQVVPRGEEGWIVSTSGEPETTKLLCPEDALQNGRVRNDQRPIANRRLDVYTGLEGCLSVSGNCPGAPKVSKVHVGGENIRVYMSSIWFVQCSSHVYEAPTSSHGILTKAGAAINHLPGRHIDNASVQRRLATAGRFDDTSARVLGLHNQQGEVTTGSISADTVLGIPSEFQGNEILPSRGESSGHSSILPRGLDPGQNINPAAITVAGQTECSVPGSIVGPSPLPPDAAVEDTIIQKVEVIQHTGDSRPESNRRIAMVEGLSEDMEREGHHSPNSRHGNRDGCFYNRMGSSMSGSQDRRATRMGGTRSPVLMRVACSLWDWCLQ